MPRFVILRHKTPEGYPRADHWDLMLQFEDALRTWALMGPPDTESTQPAELLGDHRSEYLDYEGTISGDRGIVTRWDSGEYQILSQTNSELVVRLTGIKLNGDVTLDKAEDSAVHFQYSFSAQE